MAFPFLDRRSVGIADHSINPDDVVWGVRRKSGCDALFDPAAHRGVTKHAFPARDDGTALCGYRSPRRKGRRLVWLASATDSNPSCERCDRALAPLGSAVGLPPALTSYLAAIDEAVKKNTSARSMARAEPWPEPLSKPRRAPRKRVSQAPPVLISTSFVPPVPVAPRAPRKSPTRASRPRKPRATATRAAAPKRAQAPARPAPDPISITPVVDAPAPRRSSAVRAPRRDVPAPSEAAGKNPSLTPIRRRSWAASTFDALITVLRGNRVVAPPGDN